MNDLTSTSDKDAAEDLLRTVFSDLATLCKHYRITTRRAQQLLGEAQVKKLSSASVRQVESIADTGFSRKTFQKLAKQGVGPDNTDSITTLIGYWKSDKEFPNTLPLRGEVYPTLNDLVDKYGGDLTVKFISDRLSERGLARINQNNITLIEHVNIPSSQAELLPIAGRSISDLLDTLIHNLISEGPKRPQRRLYSTRIPEDNLPEAREDIAKAIQEFRERIHEVFEKHETSSNPPARSLGVGAYFFEDDSNGE